MKMVETSAVFQFPIPPSINNLSSEIRKLIQAFRASSNESLNYENKAFESIVNSIKNKRAEFHLIAIETTHNSDMLVSFGENLINFIEDCSDESISNEDKLEYLDLLLSDAKRNETATKNTNLKIKSLMSDVVEIFNNLPDRNDVRNVDPKTHDEKEKAEQNKAFYKGLAIGVIGLGALIAIPAATSALISAGAATATETTVLGFSVGTGSIADAAQYVNIGKIAPTAEAILAKSRAISHGIIAVTATFVSALAGSESLSNSAAEENEATILGQTLDGRKEQWLERSANLHDKVSSMRPILKELEMFWEKHIDQLERLNERFQSSSDRHTLPGKQILNDFESKWNVAIQECKAYSRFIRNEVNDDIGNLNQNNRNNRLILSSQH